jgi:predicted acyltransferase
MDRTGVVADRGAMQADVAATLPRYYALDAFRGLTIAMMMLVNNPGSWEHIYAPLEHAHWHGLSFADLVFPFFLFIVGGAMVFAFRPHGYAPSPSLVRKIVVRTTVIFAIGVLLNAFPFVTDPATWRIPGVLQRIALCYAIAATLVLLLHRSPRALAAGALTLLVGYWALLRFGDGSAPYALETNLAREVDLAVFGAAHMYKVGNVPFDPEGLLSTLPAVVSVLAGFEVTRRLTIETDMRRALRRLVASGVIACVVGALWGLAFPINKQLWTSSYVVLTSGIAMLVLALLVFVVDVRGRRSFVEPLRIYGLNALAIYVVSWLWVSTYDHVRLADGRTLYRALYEPLLAIASPNLASLLFALVHVALFWLICHVLYRRNIVIRI